MHAFWKHLLVILALAFVVYGFLWESGKVPYSPHSDMVAQGLALQEILHRSIEDGHGIPFWRSDQMSGSAVFTNPASLYLFPLHAPFLFLSPEKATGIAFWLQFVSGAVVLYLFGATLGLSPSARLVMAVAWLFCFKHIIGAYAGWLAIPGFYIFPLLFCATAYALKQPGPRGVLFVAFTATLCFQGGQPQLFYYTVFFCAAFVLIFLISKWKEVGRAGVVRRISVLAGGCILGMGVSAFSLLPQIAEFQLLSRRHLSFEQLLAGHSLGFRNLLTFFYPEAFGTPLDARYATQEVWEDIAYFGILPLLLAVAGSILGWRRQSTRLLLAGFLLSLMLALDTPVLRLFFETVPGYGLFRIPGRILFLTAFFGIGLAGIGMDEMRRRLADRGKDRPWHAVITVILLSLISMEGAWYARRYLHMHPAEEVLPTPRYATLFAADKDVYRVAPATRAINYGWAAHNRIQLIAGYDHLGYTHYHTYMDLLCTGELSEPQARGWTHFTGLKRFDMLAALNVKYLISDTPLNMPKDYFTFITQFSDEPFFHLYHGFSSGDLWIHRFDRMFPRAWFAKELAIAKNEAEELALLEKSDLFSTAIVRVDPGDELELSWGAGEGRVLILEARDGYLSLRTGTEGRRFLVISEVWHPGWQAEIDGESVPLFKTNYALQGVIVPPGEHAVILKFRPVHWKTGLVISSLSASGFLILGGVAFRRGKAKAPRREQ